MSSLENPAALADRLAGEIAALGEQVRRAGLSVGDLRRALAAQSPAPAPAPAPVQQAPAPAPAAPPAQQAPAYPQPYPQWPAWNQGQYPPYTQPRQPQFPQPQPQYAQPQYPQRPPRQPAERWWEREGVISRMLAVAGAAVTLVGVVMLLVLAAQAGFFGPVPRVVSGAVFSVALLAIATRVRQRPGGHVGATALAATGVAGLYLDIVAVASLYDWVHPVLGLVLGMGVAAAGLALAVRWDSQALALIVVLGVAALAPVVAGGVTPVLLAFLLVLSVASFPAQVGRDWPALQLARTLPLVLVLFVALAAAAFDGAVPQRGTAVALLSVCVATAAFGVASTMVLARGGRKDPAAVVTMALAGIPVLLTAGLVSRPVFTGVMAVLAAGSCAVVAAVAPTTLTVRAARVVLAALAGLEVFAIVAVVASDQSFALSVLAIAVALLAGAVPMRSTLMYFVGAAFAAVGVVAQLTLLDLFDLTTPSLSAGVGAVAAGLLLVAVAAAAVVGVHRLGMAKGGLGELAWLAAGVVGLYGATVAAVAAGVLVVEGEAGFVAGHTAATVLWIVAAVGLLLWGLHRPPGASASWELGVGLTLAAAAVAKLVLFDLAALDGLYRVLAFLTVGVLLLVAGTRYARAFADRKAAQQAQQAPPAQQDRHTPAV